MEIFHPLSVPLTHAMLGGRSPAGTSDNSMAIAMMRLMYREIQILHLLDLQGGELGP